MASPLAIHGAEQAVQTAFGDMFDWPIVTPEHEKAVLEVLRTGRISKTDITMEFEREFSAWNGSEYGLCCNNGTAALHSAMWACGVGAGDEIIGPSLTYWASVLPALSLGASIQFAESDPETLCIDPQDIEHRITDRTKAIVVVHYCGYPCDMDPIMEIAEKHGIRVIEDASHAHGTLYKGRKTGTLGHIAAFSLMSVKSFAIGEGGILLTDDRHLYERALAFGHYARTTQTRYTEEIAEITSEELIPFKGLPLGGVKYRMNQFASAIGRVQLKLYDDLMAEIQKSMNLFWDELEGVPGIRPHKPSPRSGSTMGGWYFPHGLYFPDELGGLPAEKFCEAVKAEGAYTFAGANKLLHLHPLFSEADIYNEGKPTNTSNGGMVQGAGALPVTETIPDRCFAVPWLRHYRTDIIREHALAFRKVAEHADLLQEQ